MGEAIEKVRQLKPGVVMMDVSMPVMDGIEATRRIKAEWPEVRVIGLRCTTMKILHRRCAMPGLRSS